MISKEDFKDWLSQPVTKTVFAEIEQNIRGLEMELGVQAGLDPLLDRVKVGAIQAFRDVLSIEFEEITND